MAPPVTAAGLGSLLSVHSLCCVMPTFFGVRRISLSLKTWEKEAFDLHLIPFHSEIPAEDKDNERVDMRRENERVDFRMI